MARKLQNVSGAAAVGPGGNKNGNMACGVVELNNGLGTDLCPGFTSLAVAVGSYRSSILPNPGPVLQVDYFQPNGTVVIFSNDATDDSFVNYIVYE